MLTRKNSPKKSDSQKNVTPSAQPLATRPNQQPATIDGNQTQKDNKPTKTAIKTRIIVKYDVGYPNQLHIRGNGAHLNWNKGQPLKNVQANEWLWETETPFSSCEFKILINDQVYEKGNNHSLSQGATVIYTPVF